MTACRLFVTTICAMASACAQDLSSVDKLIERRGAAQTHEAATRIPVLLLKGNLEESNPEENTKMLWRKQRDQPATALPGGPLLEAIAYSIPRGPFVGARSTRGWPSCAVNGSADGTPM